MRIPKTWVPHIARRVVEKLVSEGFVQPNVSEEALGGAVEEMILDELMVEDRINEEVREILKQFESEIDKGRLDYRRLFDLTKQKIVRERNIIL